MKPRLPPRISASVNQITPATWNAIVDCLAYAMSHPRGDGITVFNRMGDTLTTDPAISGSGQQRTTAGLFLVTEDNKGKLAVGPGFVNRNGLDFTQFPGAEGIVPKSGYMCICSEPADKLGNWTAVEAKILAEPNIFGFPVARITVAEAGIEIEQYPVTVAFIVAGKRCPIAEL